MSVPPATAAAVEAAWRDHRAYLRAIATRMLADPVEAEDAVQEAYGRLAQVDLDEIVEVRGWLVVVVRRLCLDRLRSARHRRESATESVPDDPRPAAAAIDPADRVTLDDDIQIALGVVLDELSPAERSAFVLHDVFGFSFAAVGEIVGRSAAACRQLASRARRAVRTAPPTLPGSVAGHRSVTDRFIEACAGGDMSALLELLDPDVVGGSTVLGGRELGTFRGRRRVARGLLWFLGPDSGATLVPLALESGPGAVVFARGKVVGLVRIDVADGRIRHMHAFLDGEHPRSAPPDPSTR